jgi:hypothetical protein
MKFEPRSDVIPRVISIENQLETIRRMHPETSKPESNSLEEENTEGIVTSCEVINLKSTM